MKKFITPFLIGLATILLVGGITHLVIYQYKKHDPYQLENLVNEFPSSISISSISNGVKVFKLQKNIHEEDVVLKIVQVDLTKADVLISNPKILKTANAKSSYAGYTLDEYMELGQYDIVSSSGYLSSWSPPLPLGYIKIDGKEYNRPHYTWVTSGLFCVNKDNAKIETYNDISQGNNWNNCIQAGPIIMSNKKIVYDRTSAGWHATRAKNKQALICIDKPHHLQIIHTSEMLLDDLVDQLVSKSKKDGGLGCIDAVALSDGKMAGLITKQSDGDLIKQGDTNILLPTSIAVKSRPKIKAN